MRHVSARWNMFMAGAVFIIFLNDLSKANFEDALVSVFFLICMLGLGLSKEQSK